MDTRKEGPDARLPLAVYTTIFGEYDDLIDPPECFEGCDFICFTDQKNIASDTWDIRMVELQDESPLVMNRKYKMLPHLFLPGYEASLYIDANIAILQNPADLANAYLGLHDFVLPRHFERNCIFDEARECLIFQKDSARTIQKQMRAYRSAGMPRHFGLGENGILLRRHNRSDVINTMNAWWSEFNLHSSRDQLSLAFVLWSNNRHFFYMNENARGRGGYFAYSLHKRDYKRSALEKIIQKLAIGFRRLVYSRRSI